MPFPFILIGAAAAAAAGFGVHKYNEAQEEKARREARREREAERRERLNEKKKEYERRKIILFKEYNIPFDNETGKISLPNDEECLKYFTNVSFNCHTSILSSEEAEKMLKQFCQKPELFDKIH